MFSEVVGGVKSEISRLMMLLMLLMATSDMGCEG